MKIGFLQIAHHHDVTYHYPLAFACLKSYLDVHLKSPFQAVWLGDYPGQGKTTDADVVCISSLSQDFDEVEIAAANIKKEHPDALILLGGQHITHFPETLPPSVDIGVIGEGEVTFLELIKSYVKNKSLTCEALRSIKGIVFRDSTGELIKTESRRLIENINELGLPDRALYPIDKKPYLLTSRGCSYKCSFCSSRAFWGKPRHFSAEYVCKDIESIMNLHSDIGLIGIWDDLFITNRERLRKIRDILRSQRVLQKVRFACNVRANLVDEELCTLLHELRITSVSFGFESASNRILHVLKPGASVKDNLRAIQLLNKFNIPVCCSFILGVPGEREEDVHKTYRLILDLIGTQRIVEAHVNILMPMPNTEVWRQMERTGLIKQDSLRWSRLRYYASYLDTTFENPEDWACARLKNDSIYLNEDYLKEKRLLDLIVHYENKIINEMEKRKPLTPYPYYAHIDLSNKNTAHTLMTDKVKDSSCVLECGSSGGHMTQVLAQKKCGVDCIEIDKTVANLAAPFARNVYLADLEDTNLLKTLKDSSYDFIICGDILEHLRTPVNCLLQLKEKLKPGGKIIASIPNVAHGSVRLKLLKGRFEYENNGLLDRSHLKFFDFYSIVELFNDAKLLIESIDVVRIPLEHPIANIDISGYDKLIVEKIKNDKTSDIFQYVICAQNITGSDGPDNADSLYNRLFPTSVPTAVAVPGPPEGPATANKALLSKIKGQISSLICSFTKKEK